MESSSFLGSSKRAKAPANLAQVAHCLVDDCDADLSLCRDYHRRHKVCEAHSKTPKVKIAGREQRFCQQCSRFHSLVEFDEGKRSCRKRLDGHNRRRRKPQAAECMSSRNSGLVFSSQHHQHGGRLVSFSSSSPQIVVPSGVLSSSCWAGVVKSENSNDHIMLYNTTTTQQQQQQNYYQIHSSFPAEQSYKVVNQLHELLQTSSGMQDESSDKMFSVSESSSDDHRALSLLSPAGPPTSREFGFNESLHYCALGHYPRPFPAHQSKPPPPPPPPPNSDLHIFQEGSSSTAGSHQTLTFTWE